MPSVPHVLPFELYHVYTKPNNTQPIANREKASLQDRPDVQAISGLPCGTAAGSQLRDDIYDTLTLLLAHHCQNTPAATDFPQPNGKQQIEHQVYLTPIFRPASDAIAADHSTAPPIPSPSHNHDGTSVAEPHDECM